MSANRLRAAPLGTIAGTAAPLSARLAANSDALAYAVRHRRVTPPLLLALAADLEEAARSALTLEIVAHLGGRG